MKLDGKDASFIVAGVALLILVAVLAWYGGRGCSTSPHPVDEMGIDAGPGDLAIDQALDAAARHADEELARIEREHTADLAAFDEAQRVKYEDVREGGPEAVSSFLADFNRRFRDAGH